MMKTLYLDCGMGAAGDMLTAALLELLPDPEGMIDRLNGLGIPDVEYRMEKAEKCGITGTQVRILVHGVEEGDEGHHHNHEHFHDHDGDDHHHDHEHHHDGDDHQQDHDHEGHEHHHDYDDHDHHHYHDHEGHEHHHDHEDHDHHHYHDHEGHDHHHDGDDHQQDHDHEGHEHHHDHEDHDHHHDHDGHDHNHDHHHHSHRRLQEIREIVATFPVEDTVKKDILAVYTLIAEAEGHVHGKPVEEIHFHEVGTMDAVADVAAVCLILHELKPDEIVASPVHVGSGQVRCAHGILPVPAPATAYILREVPIYGGEIRSELCTPTGAALLKHFAKRFSAMPVIRTSAIGYGMGKKDFRVANCVRAIWGETEEKVDTVILLSCNVDDMTAEEMGYAISHLMDNGAREAFCIPVTMKKSRPGMLLQVVTTQQEKEKMVSLIFKDTTTIGIREQELGRYVLDRRMEMVETPYGPVRRKISFGYGVEKAKWEYDDLAMIAEREGKTLSEIRRELDRK